jgi:hypothetical protein
MKVLRILLTFSLALVVACNPIEVENKLVGPSLLKPHIVDKKDTRRYEAYKFLQEERKNLMSIDIHEEKERMNEPEEVKFLRRITELKEVYNDAVRTYRNIGEDQHTFEEFLSQKTVFEQKKRYLIRNFGI